jgi:D-ribose pyranase
MKKTGVLNRDLSALIAAMGHYDRLVVCDAGFPIPFDADYIDLALEPGKPTVLEVVEIILKELEVEEVYIASEALDYMPDRIRQLSERTPDAKTAHVPHAEFKQMAQNARGVVRTGDFTSYANVMLVSGVVY